MADIKTTMSSSRPYLVRAFNEWVLDNDCTPYIVVDAGMQGVQVPAQHVDNGQIVLNISPSAVKSLVIDNSILEFNARFGGVPMQVFVPLQAVVAIYAKENGEGMVFGSEPGVPDPDDTANTGSSVVGKTKEERPSGRPSLKVVK